MKTSIPTWVSLAGLALIVLSGPLVGVSAWRVIHSGMNDAAEWVGPDFPSRRQYERFCADFASGDAAVISWPGCTIDDPNLDRLDTVLRSAPALISAGGEPYVDRVVTGRAPLLQLTSPPLELDRSAAAERLRGTLVGADGATTCVVVSLTAAGIAARAETIAALIETIADECRIDRNQLRLAGPALDAYYLDQATHQALTRYGGLSALIILIASVVCLRSVRMGLIVFGTAFYCQVVILAVLYVCGEELNAFLIIMPSLLLVLGVSGGVHLVNYYVEGSNGDESRGGAVRALAQGWLPCTLSAVTTAIGLASLLVSRIVPIRSFGWYGAIGVMFTLALLLLIVPGACEWSAGILRRWNGQNHDELQGSEKRRSRRNRYPKFPLRLPWAVLGVCLTVMLLAGLGLPALRTSVKIDTLFHRQSPLIRDYAWLEGNIGPLVPVEVLLRFDADCPLSLIARLEMVGSLQDSLATIPEVGGTMSAATFLPPPETGGSIRSVVRRRVVERRIEQHKDRLVELGYLNATDGVELWRVTARVSIFHDQPYHELFENIRQTSSPILAGASAGPDGASAGPADGVSMVITGITPLAHQIQSDLMKDLVVSFLCALVLITVVMMAAQRSIVLGLAAMLPNVFPVVVLFGILGWLKIPVDIGSVMTASLALGMAIDGTQHFVTFFRQGLSQGQSVERSVTAAYRHCSKAILISALICGLGLLAFAASPCAAVSRCAMIICAALFVMTIGDLILLPAILMLTGRQFLRHRRFVPGGREPSQADVPADSDRRKTRL